MSVIPCSECGDVISLMAKYCPHCGRPRLYPNVRLTEQTDDLAALNLRYRRAVLNAATRGCDAVRQAFESEVRSSRAVLAATLDKLQPIASGQVELFSTFYELHRLRIANRPSLPGETEWDSLRPKIEGFLFGDDCKQEIIHAALSLSERSLDRYGECHLVLRETHVAHRTSVFEENSVAFFIRRQITIKDAEGAIRGFRAAWKDRHLLAVAKLEQMLQPTTLSTDFPGILLKNGATGADDDFIEVHLFGTITLRSVEKLTIIRSRNGRPSVGKLKALKERAMAAGVELEEVTR